MTEPRIPLDQALADTLRPTPAPAALRTRLTGTARRLDRTRRRLRLLGLAALLVAGLVGGWRVVQGPADPAQDLARAAAERHAAALPLEFQGVPDAGTPCGSWCEKRLGFAATLPRSVAPTSVVGGGICQVNAHQAAYYRLSCGDGLFVFAEAPRELKGARGFQLRRDCTALAWAEGDRAYLRVAAVR